MSLLRRSLLGIVPILEEQRTGWAVVGGLAVSARATARFTADVDLAISVESDEVAEALLRRLQQTGYELVTLLEHEPTGRIATARLRPPGELSETLLIDLLFASAGIEKEVVDESERIALFGQERIPVARVGHLIAMKILSGEERRRPVDFLDLEALLAKADIGEIERARRSVRLIVERQHARGRDLATELETAIVRFRKA